MSFDNLQVKLEDLFLRKFKHHKSMSQETPCWEAEVWIKKWPGAPLKLCSVRNSGTGGPDEIHPWDAYDVLKEVAKQLPARFYRGVELPNDYEAVLSKLFTYEECRQDLTRLLRTRIMMSEGGKVYEIKRGTIEQVQQKYPNAKILNTMNFDEALALYIKETSHEDLD